MFELPEPYKSLFHAVNRDFGADAIPELVKKGADLSYRHPFMGHTALYSAVISKRILCVEALLKNGANPNQRFTYRSPVDGRIEAERIVLHYASTKEIAIKLIDAGADVNVVDAAGITPLMRSAHGGHKDVVISLLEAGANPLFQRPKTRKKMPLTALELAESKIDFFTKFANETRRQHYDKIRQILREAEKRSQTDNALE